MTNVKHMLPAQGSIDYAVEAFKLNDSMVVAATEEAIYVNWSDVKAFFPQAQQAEANQYKAELYDEVFSKARAMGFQNITMVLEALSNLSASPESATAPGTESPDWTSASTRYPNVLDLGDGTTVWVWTPDLDDEPFQTDFQKVPFLHEAQPNLMWHRTGLKRPVPPKMKEAAGHD